MYQVTINGEVLKQTVETVKVELPKAYVIALESDETRMLHTPDEVDEDWTFGPQDDLRLAWYPSLRAAEREMDEMELEDCKIITTSVIVCQLDYKPKTGWYVYTDQRVGQSWPCKILDWYHDEETGWMGSDGETSYYEEDLKPWQSNVSSGQA